MLKYGAIMSISNVEIPVSKCIENDKVNWTGLIPSLLWNNLSTINTINWLGTVSPGNGNSPFQNPIATAYATS